MHISHIYNMFFISLAVVGHVLAFVVALVYLSLCAQFLVRGISLEALRLSTKSFSSFSLHISLFLSLSLSLIYIIIILLLLFCTIVHSTLTVNYNELSTLQTLPSSLPRDRRRLLFLYILLNAAINFCSNVEMQQYNNKKCIEQIRIQTASGSACRSVSLPAWKQHRTRRQQLQSSAASAYDVDSGLVVDKGRESYLSCAMEHTIVAWVEKFINNLRIKNYFSLIRMSKLMSKLTTSQNGFYLQNIQRETKLTSERFSFLTCMLKLMLNINTLI